MFRFKTALLPPCRQSLENYDMLILQLPDGSSKQYEQPVTAEKVAMDISPRLAQAAMAAVVDGKKVDLTTPLPDGEHTFKLLTDRDADSLEILRHTTAHVMAQAVRRVFGKDVQYTIGPALTDDFQYGFYYDFDMPTPAKQEDLEKIEQEMQKIVAEKLPLARLELPVEAAKQKFGQLGQAYKVELIDDLVKDANVSSVSLYEQGDFVDLCRGPHLPNTGKVKAFKLMSVAGAYWRGSEQNKMLTRIYGVAYFDKKAMDEHIQRVEQAKLRDHRLLGKQLGLFLISDAVGPGLPLWLPRGTVIRHQLEGWIRSELTARGYQLVITPHIGRLAMYRTSGHYPYYKDSQFPPILMQDKESACCAEHANEPVLEEGYLLKPMNCPHHIQIYKANQHSYRDLPVRLAEFGTVYRMEQSGELNGLTRVRGFTQDDAHLFCTPDQLEDEVRGCCDLVKLVLGTLGLTDYRVRVGMRDPASDKYVGDPANWERAEQNLRNVVSHLGMNYSEEKGEAAFYGPKIDFVVRDCLGREWQLGTVQVDYNLPERFGLEYMGSDNQPHRPVMVHRAPFGSMERFIGILIEHFGGAFPLWLSPVQAAVLPVSDKFNEYAIKVQQAGKDAGLRVELDDAPDKIGAKIRRWTMQKVPYLFVVGQREQDEQTVSVRQRGAAEVGTFKLDAAIAAMNEEAASRGAKAAFAAT